MKCKETYMTVWEFLRTFTVTLEFYQVEVQQKCKFLQELMKKQVNMKEFNNFPSEQVNIFHNIVGYAL